MVESEIRLVAIQLGDGDVNVIQPLSIGCTFYNIKKIILKSTIKKIIF